MISGDYILSLHQRIVNHENDGDAPVPAPRAKESVVIDPKTEKVVQKSVLFTEDYNEERKEAVEENHEENNNNLAQASYEDERSQLDFESIVRQVWPGIPPFRYIDTLHAEHGQAQRGEEED